MNRNNTLALIESFPDLYSGYTGDVMQTLMPFGFECGDGWYDIIWDLSEQLEPLGVVAVQVKEKYGTLRFYIDYGTAEAYDYIYEAEARSAYTCEACGAHGKRREGPWIETLCDKCVEGSSTGRA